MKVSSPKQGKPIAGAACFLLSCNAEPILTVAKLLKLCIVFSEIKTVLYTNCLEDRQILT